MSSTRDAPIFHRVVLAMALAAALGLAAACHAGAPVAIVADGRAKAMIVTADEPSPGARDAAAAFASVVEQMTGAKMTVTTESEFDGQSPAVMIGPSKWAAQMGIRVTQNESLGDRYVIRTAPGRVALVGNDDGPLRGSAYAVYDLLQRLGCGWYGPTPTWQVIPRRDTIRIDPLSVDERPAFLLRDIWLVRKLTRSYKQHAQALKDAWRMGGQPIGHGHALDRVIPPARYAAEHPDYFGKGQPCLTHPDVIQIAVEDSRRRIEEHGEGVARMSLSSNDNVDFCRCDRCRAVGNVSARMLYFANAVARELAKTHPDRYLLTFYAYWATHAPPRPMIQAEPGVCVMQVNEGNHVQPWDQPEPAYIQRVSRNNTREVTAFEGWGKTGAQRGIYEWWIPAEKKAIWRQVPWYSGQTALRNLRIWHKGGVRYVSHETKNERGEGFPMRWPLYYVGARGMWDPTLDSRQIMTEACDKLFGPAAPHMLEYYRTLELAMARSKLFAKNWGLPWPHHIYTPDVEKEATAHLTAAAAATQDESILARIEQERKIWDNARNVMAESRSNPDLATYFVVVDGVEAAWTNRRIKANLIRQMYAISDSKALMVLEPDGSKRPAVNDEEFDLAANVKFATTP